MAKKTLMKKLISGTLETLHPETESSVVYMTSGHTLQADYNTLSSSVGTISTNLTSLTTKVNNLINRLDMEQIYVTDDNEVIVTDDEGTQLVAVY